LSRAAEDRGIELAEGLIWSELGSDAILGCAVSTALLEVGVEAESGLTLELNEWPIGPWPAPPDEWKGRIHIRLYDHLLMFMERSKCLGACCGGGGARVDIVVSPEASRERSLDLLYTMDQAGAPYRGAGALAD